MDNSNVSFNLVDEPWIPCLNQTGQSLCLSLLDVLLRAHELREICDPSPLVTVSLYRLLLAILHRNFGPRNLDAWSELWRVGRWDEGALRQYLTEFRSRFDIFDAERPFYQVTAMDGAERHPAARLALAVAVGHNATLFDHTFDAEPVSLSPAAAARYLVATQAFAIGFGRSSPFYFQDAPLTRGYTVLAVGENLFETLALNLVAYNNSDPIPFDGDDLPVWEKKAERPPVEAGTTPEGYVDYLTWPSRRVHLFPAQDPLRVEHCQVQQGLRLSGGRSAYIDPMKSYRTDEKQGVLPVGLDPERALWRDSHALFQDVDKLYKHPTVVDWLARIDGLRRRNRITAKSTYRLAVFGFATEPGRAASINMWRYELLPLPLAYLEDRELLETLRERVLAKAEAVGDALSRGARNVSRYLVAPTSDDPGARQPRREDVQPLAEKLAPQRVFWSRLEPSFRELLVQLPDDWLFVDGERIYGDTELRRWYRELQGHSRDAFETMARGLGLTPRGAKSIALGEAQFFGEVRRILGDEIA